MTPNEIIERFVKESILLQDPNCKQNAIEAIKQYAREMCDKQIEICSRKPNPQALNPIYNDLIALFNSQIIHSPPYPKELQ